MSAGAAGLVTLGVLLLASLGVVAAGVIQLLRQVRRLKAHLSGYGTLPLVQTIAQTQARLELSGRRADTIPDLLARAHAAVAEIDDAYQRLRGFLWISALLRFTGALLES